MTSPRLLLLLTGKFGSDKQLKSIAKHIYPEYRVEQVYTRLKTGNILLYGAYRLAYRFISALRHQPFFHHRLSAFVQRLFLNKLPPPAGPDDRILAKHAALEFPALLLSAAVTPVTFLGSPKRFNPAWFDLTVDSPTTPAINARVKLNYLPTMLNHQEYLAMRKKSIQPLWLVLLGGDAKGYCFEENDWLRLTRFLTTLNTSAIMISSPRTGKDAEKLIEHELAANQQHAVTLSSWDSRAPYSVDTGLSEADVIIVTEDSASMVSEAVNTRLPVIVVRPAKSAYSSIATPLAEHLSELGAILRTGVGDLEPKYIQDWIDNDFHPLAHCWTESWPRNAMITTGVKPSS